MKFKVKITLSEVREWDTDWWPEGETPEQIIKQVREDEKDGSFNPIEFFGDGVYESKIEKV